ncbi:Hsp20/alpha crystallin family protein [Acidobacteria bacterium AH-259-D05]|nr:Hsp20/alpha crystallin family protein [Acidobacteria bacterium AH-259-D05]
MNLVRYNPLSGLGIESFMDHFFNDSLTRFVGYMEDDSRGGLWTPAADVTETENEIVFTTELPGFEKGDIDISINDGRLTITGERKYFEEKETKKHRVERWYGKFYRSFLLPKSADHAKISANLKNGVLMVTVPKKEESKPRQIPVSVS